MKNKDNNKKDKLNIKTTKRARIKAEIEEKKQHKRLKKVLRIFAIVFIISIIIFVFQVRKMKRLVTSVLKLENSVVVDSEGNEISKLGTERKFEKIEIDKIPENLKNAYIAIEDKRFYSHHGVDIKRTGGAVITYITHLGSSDFGGSSITQQFVKNVTGDNESSITRKVQEWFRAWQVEAFMSKEDILEGYFNIIYVGPNVYGVQSGAKYYFNKDVSELSLAECSFLAGLNHSPYSYNPFNEKDNSERIENRCKIVLKQMNEQGFITEEEYKNAVSEVENGLNFEKGDVQSGSDTEVFSYHTDALINEIIDDISNKESISKKFAQNYLYFSGFKVYSTQDNKIQEIMEKEFQKGRYIMNSTKDSDSTTQAAMVIIEPVSGYVIGCTGGLGEKTTSRSYNRATQAKRQTGSAGKPIAVLAPALIKKIITPASIYVDEETTFDDGKPGGYTPTDYNGFQGKMSVRRAVESSQNVPFVKIMEQVKPSESIKFMRTVGITSLTDVDDNLNLALGGLDKGISPLEMAGAYNTISNDGEYVEPTFYSKIEKSDGSLLFESEQKRQKVFSKQVAFLLKSLLKQPVEGNNGTAVYCKIPNIDVAAKTGTTNENYDRWLCGFTNYYTAVTWYGYDMNERITYSGNNPAGVIWSQVMKEVHNGLSASEFEKPEGISELAVCSDTGELATPECSNTYTEYFANDNIPRNCSVHGNE